MLKIKALVGVCALAIGGSAFAGFDELINFEEAALGTDANGLAIKNAVFSFGFIDRGSGAAVGIGPGVTPYTSDPGIEGTTFGTLGVSFVQPVTRFGFGFALNAFGLVEDAVCVDLFDTNGMYLTTLKADATSPALRGDGPSDAAAGYLFADGFGPIGSFVVEFAEIFPPRGAELGGVESRFLFDNLGYDFSDVSPVPLPTPALMGAAGLLTLGAVRRRR